MKCITQCTRCDAKWEGDFEYCLKCEPVLAQAERRGIVGAFDDRDVSDDSDDYDYAADDRNFDAARERSWKR